MDVIVGVENAGIPLAAAVSLASGLPFAFVRSLATWDTKTTNRESGASVSGQRVLLVDDAVSQGGTIEKFTLELRERATVVGVFCVVDMRDVAPSLTPTATALPIESIANVPSSAFHRDGTRSARAQHSDSIRIVS